MMFFRRVLLTLALVIWLMPAASALAAAVNQPPMRIALTAYSSSNWQIFAAVKRGFFSGRTSMSK